LEGHKGAVLSASNKRLVTEAVAALQALLSAAEPPPSDEEDQALTVRLIDHRLREIEVLRAKHQLS